MSMGFTKPKVAMATKLERIALLSRENPQAEFRWLMPHYNADALMECFNELDGKKAVGVDGIRKVDYGIAAEDAHSGTY